MLKCQMVIILGTALLITYSKICKIKKSPPLLDIESDRLGLRSSPFHHWGLGRWDNDATVRWRWCDDDGAIEQWRWCDGDDAMVRQCDDAMMRWRCCDNEMTMVRWYDDDEAILYQFIVIATSQHRTIDFFGTCAV